MYKRFMLHTRHKKFSLFMFLSVGFIDYLGLGLVFPMFTFLLFDPTIGVLPADSSDALRGLWLGILFAIAPGILFFCSPLLGAWSDRKGRKSVLSACLGIGFFSYIVGMIAVLEGSLFLLIVSRVLYGVLAGSVTVVQAGLVDLSVGEEKQKYFAFYNMVLGAGYCLGPFIGGVLSKPTLHGWFNYATPFAFAALLTLLNWWLVAWRLPETRRSGSKSTANGAFHLKRIFELREVRLILLVMFLFFFGWSFFSEFVSVFLMKRFGYTQAGIGSFYAYIGVLYALCAGVLIHPILRRFSPRRILELSMLLGGLYFFLFVPIQQNWVLWIYLLPLVYVISMIYPTATTVISNATSKATQGEVLGIYNSVQSIALMVSPFAAGSLIAQYPVLAIIMAAAAMFLSGVILISTRKSI
jgi:MFS transporter, DHA1 family, tetracycline resistance protein